MPNHPETLILHLTERNDPLGLAYALDTLSEAGSLGRVALPDKHIEKIMTQLARLKSFQAKQASSLFNRSQKHLFTLATQAKSIKPHHAIITRAANSRMGVFLTKACEGWSEKQQEEFARSLEKVVPSCFVELSVSWADHPLMAQFCQVNEDKILNKILFSNTVDEEALKILRRGKSWTQAEADLYMEKRLWPQWVSSASTKKLNIVCDPALSEDGIPLILKVSQQAWERSVFSGTYTRKVVNFLSSIQQRLRKANLELSIKVPAKSEAEERKFLKSRHGGMKEKTWGDLYLLGQITPHWIDKISAKKEIDFNDIILVCKAHTKNAFDLYISKDMVSMLETKLSPQCLPSATGNSNDDAIVDAHVLAGMPMKHMGQTLDLWRERMANISNPGKQYYHHHIAEVLYHRTMEADEKGLFIPQLSQAFWTQFLAVASHNARKLSNIALDLAQAPQSSSLWKVRPVPGGWPTINSQDVASIGIKGKLNDNVETAMRKIMLGLIVALSGRGGDHTPSGMTRPKM